MKEFDQLLKLSEINHEKDFKRGLKEHLEIDELFNSYYSELEEAKAEVKSNNTPYLEDELADVLWSWFMLTKRLEKTAYIKSQESIVKRALIKFNERILPLTGEKEHDKEVWQEVKKMQKEKLKSEQKEGK